MVKDKKPTGDPDCPEWIKLAKRAHRAILDEANVLEADDAGEVIISPEELAQRVKDARAACLEDLDDNGGHDDDSESEHDENLDGIEQDGDDERIASDTGEIDDLDDDGSRLEAASSFASLEGAAGLHLPGTLSEDESPAQKPDDKEVRRPPTAKPPPQRLGTTDPRSHIAAVAKKRRSSSGGRSTPVSYSSDVDTDDISSTVSETRRRRMKLDRAIDALGAPTSDSQGFWQGFLMSQMQREERLAEERQKREEERQKREEERQKREEERQKREEEWRREQQQKEEDRRREDRRRDDEHRMMMMMMMRMSSQGTGATGPENRAAPDMFHSHVTQPAPDMFHSHVTHPPPRPPFSGI